jgi:hypothetical protein
MREQHTEGLLRIGTPPPNGEQTIGTQNGLMLFVAACGNGVPTEANARRLVACWNACEGVPTEVLEAACSGGLPWHVADQIEHRIKLDRLLTELRNIANADPRKWDVETRDQFQPWAQNRARAAIASAEGV